MMARAPIDDPVADPHARIDQPLLADGHVRADGRRAAGSACRRRPATAVRSTTYGPMLTPSSICRVGRNDRGLVDAREMRRAAVEQRGQSCERGALVLRDDHAFHPRRHRPAASPRPPPPPPARSTAPQRIPGSWRPRDRTAGRRRPGARCARSGASRHRPGVQTAPLQLRAPASLAPGSVSLAN